MKKKTLVADLCLIVGLLAVSLVMFGVQNASKKTGSTAVVAVDGNEIARYSLSQNGVFELNNGTNTIRIENGSVVMVDAHCPDALCIKQGKMKYSGQCITCLPNRLTVTVVNGDSSVDFVL